MSVEVHVRQAAKAVLEYIEEKAKRSSHELSHEIRGFISDMKTVKWEEAYEKTMIYRILTDQMRMDHIKNKLSFLNDEEATNVKAYLDYVVQYAGR